MNLSALHVAAACAALILGLIALARRKGDPWHVAVGRLYVAAIVVVNVPVLFLYEGSGRPGPFHVLAVVSLVTTALGWLSLRRRRRGRRAAEVHGTFMTWAWIGVATAGLAQLANRQLPGQSPWPVAVVIGVATAIGIAAVPRYVSRQLGVRSR